VAEARKLAAILAADVVGYSRLMGEDEAGTAKAVRENREAATPIVREFSGRLVKTIGDGVLLEFPSLVAAVECPALRRTQTISESLHLDADEVIHNSRNAISRPTSYPQISISRVPCAAIKVRPSIISVTAASGK
jgi:class 3 adenylate cyclase